MCVCVCVVAVALLCVCVCVCVCVFDLDVHLICIFRIFNVNSVSRANGETFVEKTKCFGKKSETFFCFSEAKNGSATNVSCPRKRGNI